MDMVKRMMSIFHLLEFWGEALQTTTYTLTNPVKGSQNFFWIMDL